MTYTEQMKAAASAGEGRGVTKAHEAAIHDLYVSLGLEPIVGVGGSGYAYRGFSTVMPPEWKSEMRNFAKFKSERDRLAELIADGKTMERPWRVLLAAEIDAFHAGMGSREEEPEEAQGSLFAALDTKESAA